MELFDALLFSMILAVVAVVIYLVIHSLPEPDPYAEFDRWQECFNAGIEARNCGLEPEDNPFADDERDYDAWLDGYRAYEGLRRLEQAARGREVA